MNDQLQSSNNLLLQTWTNFFYENIGNFETQEAVLKFKADIIECLSQTCPQFSAEQLESTFVVFDAEDEEDGE